MRFRTVLVCAVVAGSLVPVASQATNCDSPIYLFARHSYPGGPYDNPITPTPEPLPPAPGAVPTQLRYIPSAVSSAVGCTVIRDIVVGGEDPTVPHEAYDSDVIYPGADTLSVRLLDHTDETAVLSATMTFAGETYVLTMTNTTDITGANASFLDSQAIQVDPASTIAGNVAEIEICVVDEECYTRTYRTLG